MPLLLIMAVPVKEMVRGLSAAIADGTTAVTEAVQPDFSTSARIAARFRRDESDSPKLIDTPVL